MTEAPTLQMPMGGQVKWTDHPLIDSIPEYRRLPDAEFLELAETCGTAAALAYHATREKRISSAEKDPFRWEFPLPHWADLEAEVMRHIVTFVPGGNNPGKSRWAASFAMPSCWPKPTLPRPSARLTSWAPAVYPSTISTA